GIRMMALAKKWRVPLIPSFHGCDTAGSHRMRKLRKELRRLVSQGDHFTVPCRAMKDELVKHGCPEHKITVHYSGIDLDQFTYKERRAPRKGPIRLLYVGRLVEKKGAEVLLKAFKYVHQVFPN